MGRDGLPDTSDELPQPRPPHGRLVVQVDLAARTDRGKVRSNNEDNYHIVRFGRYLRTLFSSLPEGSVPDDVEEPGHAIAVADGMGGRAAGEVASRMALALLVQHALATPDWILGYVDPYVTDIQERARERFDYIHQALMERGRSEPALAGMATTLALAMSLRDDLYVSHVGDSRVYLWRRGKLHRLTHDHTIGAELQSAGARHVGHLRHVLTRALGAHEEAGAPDVQRFQLVDGDRLLLCTDGLTDMVDDTTIARELGRDVSADSAAAVLLSLALDHGGRDNVTVAVARYRISTSA